MAGRKTIMVDGGVWNKVEELKHNACLRSSGDAIETAVDIVTSDKYYAGIKAQKNDSGRLYYVVESLGRTEDEAVRNLLRLEQDSVYGYLNADDIPPADETDINKCGFFVVECTKEMYYAGKLFNNPENWNKELFNACQYRDYSMLRNLFACTISKSKNGTLMADVEYSSGDTYYVLVERLNNGAILRIVDYGTSPIKLYEEILVDYSYDDLDYDERYDDHHENLYSSYNAGNYEIFRCTGRLFAECVGNIFQWRWQLLNPIEGSKEFMYNEYFGVLREEDYPSEVVNGKLTYEKKKIIDTTPEGHYYAVLVCLKDGMYGVLNVGDTANKASEMIRIQKPILIENSRGNLKILPGDSAWSSVEENGERIGKYNGVDICLVECTVEVYAKHLMKKENETVLCTVEGESGNKLAKFKKYEKLVLDISKKPTDKKSDGNKTPAKKTVGKETTKAKKTGGKK